jgi:pimeloyl-ACP methyl ester carboxylesterase
LFTDFVAVGGGRNAYVQCAGSGSPTIILESGDESDHIQWRLVEPSLAERTRTCSYDRLGTGASDKATGCRQLKDLNGDLETLLRTTGEDGPYVLVGTSGGGFLMAGFAYAHPQDVKGMAFVETPHAIIAEEAPPELLQELKCDSPMNEERRDYVAVENEAWANRERIGDIPLVVISNDYGDDYDNEEQRTNVEDQKGWFKLSPQARQVVVTSGHDVPENEPDLVIKEILQVLEATQKR